MLEGVGVFLVEDVVARRLGDIHVAAGRALYRVESCRQIIACDIFPSAVNDRLAAAALGTELQVLAGLAGELAPAVGVALLGMLIAADLTLRLVPVRRFAADKGIAAALVIGVVYLHIRIDPIIILIGQIGMRGRVLAALGALAIGNCKAAVLTGALTGISVGP